MKQDDWVTVASAGPYANGLHLLKTVHHASMLSFYRPDARPDAQPTVSKH